MTNTLYNGDNLKILRYHSGDIHDLAAIVEHEKAAIGVFLTLEKPSREMLTEASGHTPGWNKDFPKLQIAPIEDLFAGKQAQLPPSLHTFKQAEKIAGGEDNQTALFYLAPI